MPILTYEQYSKIRHKIPYTLTLKSGENFLYYFGERHSHNPADPQWAELKKFWTEFLEKTVGQKRIVFTEGGTRPIEESEEQSILQHGGMGLATFLAHQEGIEVHSPEPNDSYERSELEKQFSRDAIQYYYFARVVLQWGRMQEPKPDFVQYITRYLNRDKEKSGWGGYDFSLDKMKKLHSVFFNAPFDENDTNFFYNVSNPVVVKSQINEVAAASGLVRDEYIFGEIQKYINDGYSVFAQYGCSHVVMQEPALVESFGTLSS